MLIIHPGRSAAKLPPLRRGGLGRGLRQWSRRQNLMRNEPPQTPLNPPLSGGGNRAPRIRPGYANLGKPAKGGVISL
jgi:hypothetical protein